MCACPVPYILAGAWLVRQVPVAARQRGGRATLTALACAGALYWLRRRLKQRRRVETRLQVGLNQEQFGLSDHGFVPHASDVMLRLPIEYAAWEDAADRIPELTSSNTLRQVVESWPCLQVGPLLDSENGFSPAVRRAYTVLAIVAHAYTWCDGTQPCKVLPPALAVPLRAAASCLGLPPGLTHAALDLWNWRNNCAGERTLSGPNLGESQDNLRCINTITGTLDEEWFNCTATVVQMKAGHMVLACYDLLAEAVPGVDHVAISTFLVDCVVALDAMRETVSRLPEKCSSDVFWKAVFPSLQDGAGGAGRLGGPTTGASGANDRLHQHYAFATVAQSSISVLDAVLGVSHTGRDAETMKEMRRCMPGKHRTFLELLEMQTPLRLVLMRWRDGNVPVLSPQTLSCLVEHFNLCLDSLADFRKAHWHFVGRHVLPLKQQAELSVSAIGSAGTVPRGTNGTAAEGFLSGTIAATLAAKMEV